MKFSLLLLLGLSVIALSSAGRGGYGRQDNQGRQDYGRQNQEREDNGRKEHGHHRGHHKDDSDDSDEGWEYNAFIACEQGFQSCAASFQKYNKRYYNETILLIKDAGAQAMCSESLDASSCVKAQLNQSTCRRLPKNIRTFAQQVLDFLDYVCVDKFSGLQQNWNCVTDPDLPYELRPCGRALSSFTECNITAFTDCITNTVAANSNCGSSGAAYVSDLLTKVPAASFGCPEHKSKVVKSLHQFWFK